MPREETILIYQFSELSGKAKEKAYDEWYKYYEYPWGDEYQATLDAFADCFPIVIKDWEISTHRHSHVDMAFTDEDGLADISGVRLMASLLHNHFYDLFKGRYYSLWSKTEENPKNPNVGKLKQRHSKVMFMDKNCVLTGFCADEAILGPIYKFLEKPDGTTYKELMQRCLDSWAEEYVEDIEACSTMEYFQGHVEANEYEFNENGTRA